MHQNPLSWDRAPGFHRQHRPARCDSEMTVSCSKRRQSAAAKNPASRFAAVSGRRRARHNIYNYNSSRASLATSFLELHYTPTRGHTLPDTKFAVSLTSPLNISVIVCAPLTRAIRAGRPQAGGSSILGAAGGAPAGQGAWPPPITPPPRRCAFAAMQAGVAARNHRPPENSVPPSDGPFERAVRVVFQQRRLLAAQVRGQRQGRPTLGEPLANRAWQAARCSAQARPLQQGRVSRLDSASSRPPEIRPHQAWLVAICVEGRLVGDDPGGGS